AATPPTAEPWGVYDKGCKNGLVVKDSGDVNVSVSVDRGRTWTDGPLSASPDLTDAVKGYRQYWLRLHAGAKQLATSKLEIRTVCQANASTVPHLKDGGSTVTFAAGGTALVSAGPTLPQAKAHVVD